MHLIRLNKFYCVKPFEIQWNLENNKKNTWIHSFFDEEEWLKMLEM